MLGSACSYKALPPLDDSGTGGIDAAGGPDGPVDSVDSGASADAAVCFGTGIVQLCLQTPPSAPQTIGSFRRVDTDDATMCEPLASSNGNYCVVAATTITVDNQLRGVGRRPLVLVASDRIVIHVGGMIDVGSRRGTAFEQGAGSDFAGCGGGAAPTTDSTTGGGGAGGSFVGGGGAGGGGGTNTLGGTSAPAAGAVTALRGGCAGQAGAGSATASLGHGGGAVFLIAGNAIDSEGSIFATGEGGGGGPMGSATNGGSGGGSGGMIGFEAPLITAAGLVLANGGGGGEGSAPPVTGANGADPSDIAAAIGGRGNVMPGGDGGNGSPSTGGAGSVGQSATNPSSASGGGGGGGAGIIKAPSGANLGTNVSPPPTP